MPKKSSATEPQFDMDFRPGFMIRRLHQIHVSFFFQECGPDITPLQFTLLHVLLTRGEHDQHSLAKEVGIDRANATMVIRRLEEKGLVARRGSERDSRVKLCSLTTEGRSLTKQMLEDVERANKRTIAALEPREREQFVLSLKKLVLANNDSSRTKLNLR
jgi:DNA-binding MarR family transcriptional regulator